MPNKRTEKTQREIKEAFLTLLEKKSIEKIKVSEIVELAEVSRATFYLHFEDVYKVYEVIKWSILNELKQIFVGEKIEGEIKRENLRRRVELGVEYISENKKLFSMMIKNGDMISEIHSGAVEVFLEEFYPVEKTVYGVIEVSFVARGLLGSLYDWVSDSNGVEKKQFVAIIIHIISRFVPEIYEQE